jgi:O-acetyl-ADP-ribose deacetylase (regulator of RNase III)
MILRDTVNPYLATRAVLNLIARGRFEEGALAGKACASVIKTVAFPGMGTGTGQVSPAVCAGQMKAAIVEHQRRGASFPASWPEAQQRHRALFAANS